MKITYNHEVDIAYIYLKSTNSPRTAETDKVAFSKEFEFGVIDYGSDNEVVGIELFSFMRMLKDLEQDIFIPFDDIVIPFKEPSTKNQ